ncbi:MAG: cytochrome c3 family protein [Candidatus Acidiferrales bacterium]
MSSIHGRVGLTCVSCHGGDLTSDDPAVAMSPAKGFLGHIDRKQIPALCSKCHSNAAYIRNFNPSLRTDQYSQYLTSMHGKRLAKGDTKAAVCVDCHGIHDIQPPNDQRSRVYPLNVATTCAHCHADSDYMKEYKIPTNQFELYSQSVHHHALAVGGDLSAPTCTTCHGSHGAAPPGVDSVVRVCSTCHVFQAQVFDSGAHKDAFAALGLPGCVTCHSNHRIVQPTDAMIGTGKDAVCVTCHSEGDAGFETAQKIREGLAKLDSSIARSDELLGRAERSGMEVSEAKLAQSEARDDLTKARVDLHAVSYSRVDPEIQAGLKVTEKTWQAGQSAMAELKYRRKGLLLSFIAILCVVIGLFLMIRKLESNSSK